MECVPVNEDAVFKKWEELVNHSAGLTLAVKRKLPEGDYSQIDDALSKGEFEISRESWSNPRSDEPKLSVRPYPRSEEPKVQEGRQRSNSPDAH